MKIITVHFISLTNIEFAGTLLFTVLVNIVHMIFTPYMKGSPSERKMHKVSGPTGYNAAGGWTAEGYGL